MHLRYRFRSALVLAIFVLLHLVARADQPPPVGKPSVAAPLVFNGSDTFSSPLNTTNWVVMDRGGDLSNSELQCYKPANTTVSGGFLNLLAQNESVTCNSTAFTRTSGAVMWKTFNFQYGTVEFAGRLGAGNIWPSVWLLGSDCQASFPTSADNVGTCNWPVTGSDEIDIIDFNFDSTKTQVDQRIHAAGGAPGCSPGLTDATVNSHVYRFEWAAGSAIWKIDGVTTCTVSTNVPVSRMFLVMNVALHNTPSGLPSTTTWDYVTVTH